MRPTLLPRVESGGRRGWSVGRVLFPGALRRSVRRPSISGRRCRRPRAVHPRTRAGSPRTCAVRPCSGRGLPSRSGRPGRWWSLAPPFHPYRQSVATAAVCSLWHCPADCSGWVLPTALPCGARTFLDTVIQSYPPGTAAARPTPPRRDRRGGGGRAREMAERRADPVREVDPAFRVGARGLPGRRCSADHARASAEVQAVSSITNDVCERESSVPLNEIVTV